jgi:hypothetical protein
MGRMQRRRKRRTPFAAYSALVFNAVLLAAPFVGAQAALSAYGGAGRGYDTNADTLEATRKAIDDRFARIARSSELAPREAWAGLIRGELDTGNIQAVRGLLLAAPAMLEGEDAAALKARVAVSDASGEDGLIDAAVAYLPADVQAEYERQSEAVAFYLRPASAPQGALDAASRDEPGDGVGQLADASTLPDEPRATGFSVLGDTRDLALQAARWVRGDPIDEFAFVLSGIGLSVRDPSAQQGASIVLSARRAQKLDPEFALYLERRLFAAADPQRLKQTLSGAFQSEFGYGTSGISAVESAFRARSGGTDIGTLLQDFRIIDDIARETSPVSAVTLLAQVRNASDLRRARLVAHAGGDRAVALALHDRGELLDTAKMVVNWSPKLRDQLVLLGVCFGGLLLLSITVMWRSLVRDRPKRRSAVYRLEEVARF